MNKIELGEYLLTKGWSNPEPDVMYKNDKERMTLRYDGARFQKWSVVNGWRTLFFQKYESLYVTPEGKLKGWNVMIRNEVLT